MPQPVQVKLKPDQHVAVKTYDTFSIVNSENGREVSRAPTFEAAQIEIARLNALHANTKF